MNPEYKHWLAQLKAKIRSSQIKAALKVNAELILLYWQLGVEILQKEKTAVWGKGLLSTLSKDLQTAFPEMKGFSLTNIKYIRLWVNFYLPSIRQQVVDELQNRIVQQVATQTAQLVPRPVGLIGQQAVDQMPAILTTIPWGHHLQIITKCKKLEEALFYIQETSAHNWSRAVLLHQIESGLYHRKGGAVTNFETTLPKPQSDLAKELLKDPYSFDFLSLGEEYKEREIAFLMANS